MLLNLKNNKYFWTNSNVLEFNVFQATDILSITFWSFIIVVYINITYGNNKHKPHYKYFIPNMIYKFVFGLAFASIYIFYYKGGDTVWYWDGSVKLVNLLLKDPLLYVDIIARDPTGEMYYNYFDANTGYPPSWIYRENDSFYVCKLLSPFAVVALKSYFGITILFAFMASMASWKLFELILEQNFTSMGFAALAILFIPSVNFWGTGIMKDTIVTSCLFFIIYYVNKVFVAKDTKQRLWNLVLILLLGYWIFKIRSFMLICAIPCMLVWVNYEFLKTINNNLIRQILLPLSFMAAIGAIVILYSTSSSFLGSYSADKIVNTAMVIQKDFQGNESYNNRYNIGNVDGSAGSMVTVIPNAILASLYRPYIWEANNVLMIFNGLESLLFMFLTFRFLIRHRLVMWIPVINKNKFLLFMLLFVLVLGYFVGFTALIFGALVRFKAPILPFFVLILLVNPVRKRATSKNKMQPELAALS